MSGSTSGTYHFLHYTRFMPTNIYYNSTIIECPDTDGDGVQDITENSDGTNPNDSWDYVVNSQNVSKTTNAWKNGDCDGGLQIIKR